MNPLTSLLLIANPLVTAVLAVVVFLESKKQRNLLEAVEKAVRESSRQVIEAVERQKEGFDAIATSLRVISEDQGKSVETFTGISNALTTSSRTNEHSLKNVVSALDYLTYNDPHRADATEWLNAHGWIASGTTSTDEMRRLDRWVDVPDQHVQDGFSTFVVARRS